MLPVAQRALIIGLMGPAIQALGFVWTALHLLFIHWGDTFGPRHLMYEPGVLLIVIGFAISVVCVPVALEVAKAAEEDVDIPVYTPEATGSDGGEIEWEQVRRGRLARYSTGRAHPPTGQDQPGRSPG